MICLYNKKITWPRVKRKTWSVLVHKLNRYSFYPLMYRSYWHALFYNRKGKNIDTLYYTSVPNPGAGIGHQMANWISGFWFAKQFGLKFAHIPFAKKEWDDFLGFGEGEITVSALIEQGYKIRRLPLFYEESPKDVQLQRKIITSYAGLKIVFVTELDQFYHDQYGVMEDIKRKFYSSPARNNDSLVFEKSHFNIAIHVRRGDIMSNRNNKVLTDRILPNKYYYNVLNAVMKMTDSEKNIHIYFFSQGTPEDFPEFNEFENLHWCFDMSAQQSFLHMVYSDMLVISKSSFSYKPALLNRGIIICPKDFWHGYPDNNPKWILCDKTGQFDMFKLEKLLN